METAPQGALLRVVANSGNHNYEIGSVVTVETIDSDGTFKGRKPSGELGNWLRFRDCVAAGPTLWSLLSRDMPGDVRAFLSCFEGVERLEVREDIAETILLSLPDLNERLIALAHAREARKSADAEAQAEASAEAEADDDVDDFEGIV